MKKLKFIAIAIISLVAFSSCTEENPEEWYVENFEILSENWELIGRPDEVGSYYQYIFDKIPLNVSFHDGIITAYLYLDNGVQTPLPYIESALNSVNELYTLRFSYDIATDNTIAFKVHVNDDWTGRIRPGTERFRLAMIW